MRPTLNDPVEYALIKKMYFSQYSPVNDDTDQREKLDRLQSRLKKQNSR